jgi:tRNA-2-methylthio-N6-dimethylallyladenosine synthase
MTMDVVGIMAKHHNICKHIHLPVQSGSDRILKLMNRQHTAAEYRALIDQIKNAIPLIAISQDMITGFPSETEDDHQQTLDLMDYVQYDYGYMYAYSERPGTAAGKNMEDDVPESVKKRRLTEIIDRQSIHSKINTERHVGLLEEVLIEGDSKRSDQHWMGRNLYNQVVVFPKEHYKKGDTVQVRIDSCTSGTLIGTPIQLVL